MSNGWIKLHRKFTEWEWYKNDKTKALFLHLLLMANHKDNNWQGITIKRGQLITGLESLHKETGIKPQSLRTSIKKLISTGEITNKSTNKFRIITIIKYDEYQSDEQKPTSKSTSKLTINQQTTNKQLTPNNNDKNVKNDKNINTLQATPAAEIIPDLLKDKQKHIQIIGLWAKAKKVSFTSREHQGSFIRRNLKASKNLVPYKMERIVEIMAYLIRHADFKATLESVGKYIDEDLTKLNNKGTTFV